MSENKTEKSGFLNVDPTREYRLQKELTYENLAARRQDSDPDFEKWAEAFSQRNMTSYGITRQGEEVLAREREEYGAIREARIAARQKQEREEALSKIINKWLVEKTPLWLMIAGTSPELAAGTLIKFSGFAGPGAFLLVQGDAFVRKIAVSDKWTVSRNGENISDGTFVIAADGLGMDAAEKLFGVPIAELLTGAK